MKKPELVKAIDKVIDIKMKAVDRLMEELVEPLANIGSPEKLLGKPYEQWTPEEMSMMIKIYGTEEPNPLSNLIFNKTLERVERLEAEEL